MSSAAKFCVEYFDMGSLWIAGTAGLTGLAEALPGNKEYDCLRICVRFAEPGSDEIMDSGMTGIAWPSSSAFVLTPSYWIGLNGKASRLSKLAARARTLTGLGMPSLLACCPSSSAGMGFADRGEASCLLNAPPLNDDIPSCFPRGHGPVVISKEMAAVLDLRNIWSRPAINPDRLRTTVAIIDSLIFPVETVTETK
jgi:hypothetical protein